MKPGIYFTWSELTSSSTATREGIDNHPTPEHAENLRRLCAEVLDPLRTFLGRPVRITSGYRSLELNKKIGGSTTSRHCSGLAADIKVSGMDAVDIARTVHRMGLPIDQCIWYSPERGGHVHLGLVAEPKTPRGMYLYAPPGSGYNAWKP